MKTLLELDSLAAHYGPVQALRDVSLTVGEGEVVAVLGANGAGKTTTLRAISGTVARSGTIELDGKEWKIISDFYTADRKILDPMVKDASAKYGAEKKIEARDCSKES